MSNLRNSQLLQQMESNPLRSSLAKALDIAEEFQGAIEFVSGNRDLSPECNAREKRQRLCSVIRVCFLKLDCKDSNGLTGVRVDTVAGCCTSLLRPEIETRH
jgi:hypothetical protein